MKPKDILFKKVLPLLYGCLLVLIEIKLLYYINGLTALLLFFLLGLLCGTLVYNLNKDFISIGWMTLTSTALPTLILVLSFLISPENRFGYSIVCLILSNWLSTNLPCFVLRLFTHKAEGPAYKTYSKFIGVLFILSYTALMLFLLFSNAFSYRSGHRTINLVPFKTIILYVNAIERINPRTIITNILGNILLFVPLGFYLKAFIKNFKYTFLTIVSIPITIELLQYLFATGAADIDDIILNIIGEIMGLFLLSLINLIYHKLTNHSKDNFLGF